jgi:hypothetical protein
MYIQRDHYIYQAAVRDEIIFKVLFLLLRETKLFLRYENRVIIFKGKVATYSENNTEHITKKK